MTEGSKSRYTEAGKRWEEWEAVPSLFPLFAAYVKRDLLPSVMTRHHTATAACGMEGRARDREVWQFPLIRKIKVK